MYVKNLHTEFAQKRDFKTVVRRVSEERLQYFQRPTVKRLPLVLQVSQCALSLNTRYAHHCYSHSFNRPTAVGVEELLYNQVKPHKERYSKKYYRISTSGNF